MSFSSSSFPGLRSLKSTSASFAVRYVASFQQRSGLGWLCTSRMLSNSETELPRNKWFTKPLKYIAEMNSMLLFFKYSTRTKVNLRSCDLVVSTSFNLRPTGHILSKKKEVSLLSGIHIEIYTQDSDQYPPTYFLTQFFD